MIEVPRDFSVVVDIIEFVFLLLMNAKNPRMVALDFAPEPARDFLSQNYFLNRWFSLVCLRDKRNDEFAADSGRQLVPALRCLLKR